MSHLRCPYCPSPTGRCAATAAGRSITSCSSCGRAIQERQTHTHPLFLLRAHDTSLPVVTPDLLPLSPPPSSADPFHPTGFITAFSTWSLEPSPVFARSTSSFAGHLAELERALDADGVKADPSGPKVSVEHLRAYLQILDVGSILGLEHDIADHAFQLFRDCSSATCLRNRNVEALATAALVQAIREAQEPRTLQEISAASKLPQKEIGKYIKILGESLQLSQPINSNSIAVHMPRFCTLLQLNKSAQELAAHIGEVVVNKCFCTRRNPISISAAAIYLACQLEDKRKTQAEICKVTGLTEVTLRKVYKELLENWDDLLPPNYTPAVPPEKAFPTTAITSGRSSTPKVDVYETSHMNTHQDKEKHLECKRTIIDLDAVEMDHPVMTSKSSFHGHSQSLDTMDLNKEAIWQQQIPLGIDVLKPNREKETNNDHAMTFEETKSVSGCIQKVSKSPCTTRIGQAPTFSNLWQANVSRPSYVHSGKQQTISDSLPEIRRDVTQREADKVGRCHDTD